MAAKRRTRSRPAIQNTPPSGTRVPTAEIPAWLDRLRTRHALFADDAARNIFLERAFDAVIEITKALPLKVLEESAAAGNNFLVLLKALQSPEVLPELGHYEPLASPYLKGLQAQQDLLAQAGGLMSSEEVANLLSLTRQAIDKRRKAGRLIAVPQGQRGFGYPVCQFTARGPIPGLDQMLLALGAMDPWGQLSFLLSANSALDNRLPIDLLREDQIAAVVRTAGAFGEHGAL